MSVQRLEETFTASSQALKLFMFLVSIFRLVLREINNNCEYSLAGDSKNLFEQIQEIYATKDWDVCLRIYGYMFPISTKVWHWRLWIMLKRQCAIA